VGAEFGRGDRREELGSAPLGLDVPVELVGGEVVGGEEMADAMGPDEGGLHPPARADPRNAQSVTLGPVEVTALQWSGLVRHGPTCATGRSKWWTRPLNVVRHRQVNSHRSAPVPPNQPVVISAESTISPPQPKAL
jgi:hypothetical protein